MRTQNWAAYLGLVFLFSCNPKAAEHAAITEIPATGLKAAVDSTLSFMDPDGHGEVVQRFSRGQWVKWSLDSLVLCLKKFQKLDFNSLEGVRYRRSPADSIVHEECWSQVGNSIQDQHCICRRKLNISIPLEEGKHQRIILSEYETSLGSPPESQRLLLVGKHMIFERLVIGEETIRISQESRLLGLDDAIAILDADRESK